MAVKRQKNWLGQQRVDTTHLREIESAVAGDFDDLAGKVLASSRPIVVHGMTISMGAAVGDLAQHLVLNTAGAILLHGTASEPGAVFVVPTTQAAETLGTSNAAVTGSFTPNSINYIGIDLIRLTDATTEDTVKFRSATTKKEFSQQVPLARTLQYRVIISTNDFNLQPNVAPVAKVQLNASSVVQSVTDCREMMFRLGSGGSVPNALDVFSWPGGRSENPVTSTTTTDPFSGADKSIASFIDFFHAMESRLWEVGGGEHWYSQTTDRDVLFVRDPATLFAGGENFEWTGTNIHWKGISFSFGNSTAVKNTITQQLVDSAGLTDLAVGQCIYVDVDRAVDAAALTTHKASLASLGTPTIPGSRHIIAWRTTEGVFGLGIVYPIGFAFLHASTTAYGVVKLWAVTDTDAIVPAVDSAGIISARGISRDAAGTLSIGTGINNTAVDVGRASILTSIYGSLQVNQGITAQAAVGGDGISGQGDAGGHGVIGISGSNAGSIGVFGTSAATNGSGVSGNGTGTGTGTIGNGGTTSGLGVLGTGGTPNGSGVEGRGTGTGRGIQGFIDSGGSIAVYGDGTGATTNGTGVKGTGKGNGQGVLGVLSGGTGPAIVGDGSGATTNSIGVYGTGKGFGQGVLGVGGATGAGVEGAGAGGVGGQFSGTNNVAAAINLTPQGSPAAPTTGDVWFSSATNQFHGRAVGVTFKFGPRGYLTCSTTGSGVVTVLDNDGVFAEAGWGAAVVAGDVAITFATARANANYCVQINAVTNPAGVRTDPIYCWLVAKTVNGFTIKGRTSATGVIPVDMSFLNDSLLDIVMFGA